MHTHTENDDCAGGDRLLSVDAAAELLDLPVSSFWQLLARGQLPAGIKLGRRTRWSRRALERWISEQHQAAQAAGGG